MVRAKLLHILVSGTNVFDANDMKFEQVFLKMICLLYCLKFSLRDSVGDRCKWI